MVYQVKINDERKKKKVESLYFAEKLKKLKKKMSEIKNILIYQSGKLLVNFN